MSKILLDASHSEPFPVSSPSRGRGLGWGQAYKRGGTPRSRAGRSQIARIGTACFRVHPYSMLRTANHFLFQAPPEGGVWGGVRLTNAAARRDHAPEEVRLRA
ncbi:MAG: hypothetical protein RR410_03805 [Alistipes sp.]